MILSFLDVRDLCTAARVSRNWHRLASSDPLWVAHCRRDGIDRQSLPPQLQVATQSQSWKGVYRAMHMVDSMWRGTGASEAILTEHDVHVNHVVSLFDVVMHSIIVVQITGLQVIDDERFATCSDDLTIKIWSFTSKSVGTKIAITNLWIHALTLPSLYLVHSHVCWSPGRCMVSERGR